MARMNSKAIICCLARDLQPYSQIVIPEASYAGGICDLLAISRAGYVTEYEVKVSLADWNADRGKQKWGSGLRHLIKRFVYAIPPELEHKIPDWLEPHVGVVVADDRFARTRVVRTGDVNRDAPKIKDGDLIRLLHNCYSRLWTDVYWPRYRDAWDACREPGSYEIVPATDDESFVLEGRAE